MDIDLQYQSLKGLRAQCLRPWLYDGWPSFRLAYTLLPLLTSKPLLALWASHEHYSLFFLITLLTFYIRIRVFWCIFSLFGNFMSHGLIGSHSSLFCYLSNIILYHTSLFISFVPSFVFVITFLSMPWVMIFHILMHGGQSYPLSIPSSWTLVWISLVEKVILSKRVHVNQCLRLYPFHYVFLVKLICWYSEHV